MLAIALLIANEVAAVAEDVLSASSLHLIFVMLQLGEIFSGYHPIA